MTDFHALGPTKTDILTALREGPRPAQAIASRLGIQVSAARKHLERLIEMGFVREEFVRGARGRPKKHYRITDEGLELFPRRYDAILNGLLTTIVEARGEAFARDLLSQQVDRMALPLAGAKGARRTSHALNLLNDLKFEVSANRSAGELTLTSRNCPILRVAQVHRELVCAGFHAELIRKALRAKRVTRGKWIASGDSVCMHIVET